MTEHEGNENFPTWPLAGIAKLLENLHILWLVSGKGNTVLWLFNLNLLEYLRWYHARFKLHCVFILVGRLGTKQRNTQHASRTELSVEVKWKTKNNSIVINKDGTLRQGFRKQHNSSISKYLSHYYLLMLEFI